MYKYVKPYYEVMSFVVVKSEFVMAQVN